MPKIYSDMSVLDATLERYEFIFNEFGSVYLSISGGKDSSVMMQLASRVAREKQKVFSLLFIDLEAQYRATINHVEELIEDNKDVLDGIYWVALPISLRNGVSIIQPKWICWDTDEEDKWVREMPRYNYVINQEQNCPFDWFKKEMEFEEFILYFAEWFNKTKTGSTACGVAIRANESLNRFRTIISDIKVKYKGKNWTTQVKFKNKFLNVFNFYPLYDWRTEDIWGAVSRFDMTFNEIYELMYKNGLSIHQQRLCQPYGDDQRDGLDQFRALEPETWEKILKRVHGVNFGNIYARTSLLGNIKSEKPKHLTWQQYTVYLLETIGLYAPELRDHYYEKIRVFLNWYEKKEGIKLRDIPDENDKKLESNKQAPSWRRIARAIERNDFWMKRLSFGQTKDAAEKLRLLKEKYKGFLLKEKNTTDKHLKEWLANERG